jgi:hypothetical protein
MVLIIAHSDVYNRRSAVPADIVQSLLNDTIKDGQNVRGKMFTIYFNLRNGFDVGIEFLELLDGFCKRRF